MNSDVTVEIATNHELILSVRIKHLNTYIKNHINLNNKQYSK